MTEHLRSGDQLACCVRTPALSVVSSTVLLLLCAGCGSGDGAEAGADVQVAASPVSKSPGGRPEDAGPPSGSKPDAGPPPVTGAGCSPGVSCDDGNPCTIDSCKNGVGCVNAPVDDGVACADSNICNGEETCLAGACVAGKPLHCDDENPCTVDSCAPELGCHSAPIDGVACDDGSADTVHDTCSNGVCSGVDLCAGVVCVRSDECHDIGSCDHQTGLCSDPVSPDLVPCNDGNACTQVDVCLGGICTGRLPVVCASSEQCLEPGLCDPGTGVCSEAPKPDGTACDDGDPSTEADSCHAGSCQGQAKPPCTPVPSGIVSWWPGDGDANDHVGANDATPNGDVTYVPGMVGQAFHFANMGYLKSGTAGFPTGGSDRTLEAWVRVDTTYSGYFQSLFMGYGTWGYWGGTSQLYAEWRSNPAGKLCFSQWGDAVATTEADAAGEWYHLAVSIQNKVASLYLNGVMVDSHAMALSTPSGTSAYFGGYPENLFGQPPEWLTGVVDEPAIYARALSGDEIAAIYAAGGAGKCK